MYRQILTVFKIIENQFDNYEKIINNHIPRLVIDCIYVSRLCG